MANPWDMKWYHSTGEDLGGAIGAEITDDAMISWDSPANVTGVTLSSVAASNAFDLSQDDYGVLRYVDATKAISWQAPGGSEGTPVALTEDASVYLYDGDDQSKWIAAAIDFSELPVADAEDDIDLTVESNVLFDTVDADESEGGDEEYHAVFLKNDSGDPMTGVRVCIDDSWVPASELDEAYSNMGSVYLNVGDTTLYPNSGTIENERSGEWMYYSAKASDGECLIVSSSGRGARGSSAAAGIEGDSIKYRESVDIALEEPTAGELTVISAEGEAPDGITFDYYGTDNYAVIGNMADGDTWGLWIRRTVPQYARPLTGQRLHIKVVFDL